MLSCRESTSRIFLSVLLCVVSRLPSFPSPLFLGGVDSTRRVYLQNWPAYEAKNITAPSFSGCLRQLRLGDNSQSPTIFSQQNVLLQENVTNDCPLLTQACNSAQCGRGYCVPKYLSETGRFASDCKCPVSYTPSSGCTERESIEKKLPTVTLLYSRKFSSGI